MGLGGLYEGVNWAAQQVPGVPATMVLKKAAQQQKLERQQALAQFETDLGLPMILDDIKKNEEEAKARMDSINRFADQMAEAPPMMPTGTELTLGEGIAGVLGSGLELFGGGSSRTAEAVNKVAQERQNRTFQNNMAAYAQRQKTAGLKMGLEQDNLGYVRQLMNQSRGELAQRKNALASMKYQDAQTNAEQNFGLQQMQAKMISDNQAAQLEQSYRMQQAALAAAIKAAETKSEREYQAKIAEAKIKNEAQAKQIETIIAGLKSNRNPDAVAKVVSDLAEWYGFELPESTATMFKSIATANQNEDEYKRAIALQTAGRAKDAHRLAGSDLETEALIRAQKRQEFFDTYGFWPEEGNGSAFDPTNPPAGFTGSIGGGAPGKGLPKVPPDKPYAGAAGEGYMRGDGVAGTRVDLQLGSLKWSNDIPEAVLKRPPTKVDKEIADLQEKVGRVMLLKDQIAEAKKFPVQKWGDVFDGKPDKAGSESFKPQPKKGVDTSKIEEEIASLNNEIQVLRQTVGSKAGTGWKSYVERVRTWAKGEILKASKSQFEDRKQVQEGYRRVFQVLTGEREP